MRTTTLNDQRKSDRPITSFCIETRMKTNKKDDETRAEEQDRCCDPRISFSYLFVFILGSTMELENVTRSTWAGDKERNRGKCVVQFSDLNGDVHRVRDDESWHFIQGFMKRVTV